MQTNPYIKHLLAQHLGDKPRSRPYKTWLLAVTIAASLALNLNFAWENYAQPLAEHCDLGV